MIPADIVNSSICCANKLIHLVMILFWTTCQPDSILEKLARFWWQGRWALATFCLLVLSGCGDNSAVLPGPPVTAAAAAQAPRQSAATPSSKPVTPTVIEPNQLPSRVVSTVTLAPAPGERATAPVIPAAAFGYTHQRADGNRFELGRGTLPDSQPLDISLNGKPEWVVAALSPARDGSLWVIALADGQVQAFQISGQAVEAVAITPSQLPPGMPPALRLADGVPQLLAAPAGAASPYSHPVSTNESGRMAFIDSEGAVVIWQNEVVARLPVNALPDARLLVDEAGRILVLTEATTRYGHGVLGDAVEAAAITLIETQPTPRIALTIPISGQSVVEGIAPIWADLDGDGLRDIIVTLSNAEQGAQLVVFNEAGEQIAAGPAIGQGSRWRHQIAVAPFGPNGELELADVLTPHLGRVVEFFRLEGDALVVVAQLQAGYTSHAIGSRNLDTAVAGDFDGDGRVELLLPNSQGDELGAIRRTPESAELAWTVAVGGPISTNLAAAAHGDQGLAVGLGRADGVLRLWLP